MKWSAHLDILSRLDPAEIRRHYPELPQERTEFWASVYSACMILTDALPQINHADAVTPWYVIRGRAEVYLGRHHAKLYRHTKQFEFRGKLWPVPVCLLEGKTMLSDDTLRNMSLEELRKAVAFKNHTLLLDATEEQILAGLTNTGLVAEAIHRNISTSLLNAVGWPAIQSYLLGTEPSLILDCISKDAMRSCLAPKSATPEQLAAFRAEWDKLYSSGSWEVEILPAAFNVDAYQKFTKTIWSSPADAERWNAALPSCISMLTLLKDFIADIHFDKIKKFCAYGRLPLGLELAVRDGEFLWHLCESKYGPKVAESPELSNPVVELMHGMFGIISEVEELCEAVAGPATDGSYVLSLVDRTNVAEELGGILYYISRVAEVFGFTLSQVFALNQQQLESRYAGGFTTAAANNRDLPLERAVMEKIACVSSAAPLPISSEGENISGQSLVATADSIEVAAVPLFCHYCGKSGHVQPSCPELASHLAESTQGEPDSIDLSPEEITTAAGRRIVDEDVQTA